MKSSKFDMTKFIDEKVNAIHELSNGDTKKYELYIRLAIESAYMAGEKSKSIKDKDDE